MGRRQRASRPAPPATPPDEELDIQAFSDSLRPAGLVIRDVANDGNCFFRAVSDQLYGSEDYHNKLRQRACDYLENHKLQYQHFVDDEQSFDEYVQDMRNDAVWADNVELQAISMACGVNIRIHQSGKPSYDIRNHPTPNAPAIHLSYHFGEHYASVRPLRTATLAAPAEHDPLPVPLPRNGSASTDSQRSLGSRRPRKNDNHSVGAVWRRAECGYLDMCTLVDKTCNALTELRSNNAIGDDPEHVRLIRAIESDMKDAQDRLEQIAQIIRDGKKIYFERTHRIGLALKPNPSVQYDDEEEYRMSVRQQTDTIFDSFNETENAVVDATKSVVSLRASTNADASRSSRGNKRKEQEARKKDRKERRRREQERVARGDAGDMQSPKLATPHDVDIAI